MSHFHCRWSPLDLAAVELEWIEKNHPHSLQILDIYHALQYAWDFVKLAIIDVNAQKSWIEAAPEAR